MDKVELNNLRILARMWESECDAFAEARSRDIVAQNPDWYWCHI